MRVEDSGDRTRGRKRVALATLIALALLGARLPAQVVWSELAVGAPRSDRERDFRRDADGAWVAGAAAAPATRGGERWRIPLGDLAGRRGLALEFTWDERAEDGRTRPRAGVAEVRLLARRGAAGEEEIALPAASADSWRRGAPPIHAIDRTLDEGWEPRERTGRLWVTTAEPLVRGRELELEIVFTPRVGGAARSLRVAATSDEDPLRGRGCPLTEGRGGLRSEVATALDRARTWLLGQADAEGRWGSYGADYESGATALAIYAALKAGADPADPAIERGRAFIAARSPQRTYTIACEMLALDALGAPDEEIAGRLRRLLSWQLQGGESLPFGWSYPGEDPAALAPDAADLSNTQYAALGLWVASERRGLVVPDAVWLGLGRAVLRFQEVDPPGGGGTGYPPAGFGYRAGAEPTGSMTVAGVGILSLCRRALGRRAPGAWVVAEKRGLAWLATHFSAVGNPGAKGATAGGWSGYYRYGLERTATWCEEERLGPYDWYGLGAWHLVETQRSDGDWGNLEETIFAILFLSRATAQSTGRTRRQPTDTWRTARDAAVCEVVAQGRGPTALWIAGWTDALRESLAWPGEEAGGPRVGRVVWEEFRDGRNWREVAEIAGDGSRPAGTERFAAQVRLRGKGPWRVRARIEIAPPGARRRTIELRSAEVVIPIAPREDEADPEAATRPLRRLPLLGWTFEADSRDDARSAASRAGDGSERTAWRARAGAVRPGITLRSPRPVTVSGLRISQPREHRLRLGPRAGAQALRVEIRLDGGPPVGLAMPSDPVRPLEHVLIRPRAVSEISVRIIDARPSDEGPGPGFAEIEVLVVD